MRPKANAPAGASTRNRREVQIHPELNLRSSDLINVRPNRQAFNDPLRLASAEAVSLLADPTEVGYLDDATIQWLMRHGIGMRAITTPWAVRCGRVLFDGHRDRYRPVSVGEFALIIGVFDNPSDTGADLGALDLIAWCPKSGRLGTRLGRAIALGEDQIGLDALGTTGLPLPIHRSPLGWLQADRRGIVIADWEMAAFELRGLILQAEDDAHRRQLARRLTPTPSKIAVASPRTVVA